MNKLFPYLFLILILILILILSSCSIKVREIDYSKAPKNAKELIAKVISKNKIPEWLSLQGKINLIQFRSRDITPNYPLQGICLLVEIAKKIFLLRGNKDT